MARTMTDIQVDGLRDEDVPTASPPPAEPRAPLRASTGLEITGTFKHMQL